MDRSEAIKQVVDAWDQIEGEFCVGDMERQASEQECWDVLVALGCTPEEIEVAGLTVRPKPVSVRWVRSVNYKAAGVEVRVYSKDDGDFVAKSQGEWIPGSWPTEEAALAAARRVNGLDEVGLPAGR